MMECVGISCFDPTGEPEEELISLIPEGTRKESPPKQLRKKQAWRTEAPTRGALRGACALCHLVYWWQGPQHRSLASLREDALKHEAPAALAPPCEERAAARRTSFRTGTRSTSASRRFVMSSTTRRAWRCGSTRSTVV